MLFVAICDDEIGVGAELERSLITIFNELNIQHEIDVLFSGEELLKMIDSGVHYDLIFLDIEFAKDKIDGVEVGNIIRESHKNNMVSIVYISWERKYSMDLFDIRPLNFLIKPLQHEKIEKVARVYLDISGLWSKTFTYKIGHDTFKVHMKDVVYIQSQDRKLILHLQDGRTEEFYGSIKEVYEEQLRGFDFLFIHASYIVNYDFISKVEYGQLSLSYNGIALPISKNKRTDVRERYYAITERRRT
jgi:DNA-binding LytR/AlgR family response regulator